MEEGMSAFKTLRYKSTGERPLRRLRTEIEDICVNTRNWNDSDQGRDYLKALVNVTLNFRIPQAMEQFERFHFL